MTPSLERAMVIPQRIVLDASGWLVRLRGAVNTHAIGYPSCAYPEFALDLFKEIVEHIRDRRWAEIKLREFAAEIQSGAAAGGDFVPPPMAPLVLEIGREMLRQLEQARAYLPSGLLPYHYHLLPRQEDNYVNVVLERTNQLPR